jgi:hypothetical protein
MVLEVTSRYVRVLPGVVMPFIAADEDGRDTLVCKSSSRASSNKVNELLCTCSFLLNVRAVVRNWIPQKLV